MLIWRDWGINLPIIGRFGPVKEVKSSLKIMKIGLGYIGYHIFRPRGKRSC